MEKPCRISRWDACALSENLPSTPARRSNALPDPSELRLGRSALHLAPKARCTCAEGVLHLRAEGACCTLRAKRVLHPDPPLTFGDRHERGQHEYLVRTTGNSTGRRRACGADATVDWLGDVWIRNPLSGFAVRTSALGVSAPEPFRHRSRQARMRHRCRPRQQRAARKP